MKLIVGLGNPGSQYNSTRHNAGFDFVNLAVKAFKTEFQLEKKFKGELAQTSHTKYDKILFLKPHTFMNLSGESVLLVCQFYKIAPQDVLVAHDDLDMPLGSLRFAKNGGPAGHNGLRSIIQLLNTHDFARLKLGIGRPSHPSHEIVDFVLQKFTGEQAKSIEEVYARSLEGLKLYFDSGLDVTMNRYNQKIR